MTLVDCGSYCDYYLAWEQVFKTHPDHPILIVKYEDCIQDLPGNLRKIAGFLGHPLAEDKIQAMTTALSFHSMKRHFQVTLTEELIRKGEVGDWVNWLTEDQSADLDKLCENLKDSHFEPTY
ncbi:sulfotransferase [Plakobranchus ocellatus]|uniref:Sulfotransferase n=1 Tax=Plakobranchus ocellatus TaxID=259542 RepID=A0AAV4ANP6_9GAST|nr:sulfotransferase [Plakobranchus ocellatus]